MLSFKALQIFDILGFQPVDNQTINELPPNNHPVANQQIIEILNKTIDLLTEQLQTKDEQLATKEETIQKLIQLQHNNQFLQLEAKKTSIFEKIFRKKLDA